MKKFNFWMTCIIFVYLITGIYTPTYADRLDEAVKNLTKTTYGSKINRLDEDEIDELAENISDTADNIRDNGDREAARHIEKEHRRGNSSLSHIEKCPYCRGAAVEVAQNTPLEDYPPRNRIPRCFGINGAPYGAGGQGELYRLHPQTLQVIGPPEGFIWFQSGQYIGVGYNGARFKAQPFNC